jgi:hypothetical protein
MRKERVCLQVEDEWICLNVLCLLIEDSVHLHYKSSFLLVLLLVYSLWFWICCDSWIEIFVTVLNWFKKINQSHWNFHTKRNKICERERESESESESESEEKLSKRNIELFLIPFQRNNQNKFVKCFNQINFELTNFTLWFLLKEKERERRNWEIQIHLLNTKTRNKKQETDIFIWRTNTQFELVNNENVVLKKEYLREIRFFFWLDSDVCIWTHSPILKILSRTSSQLIL